MVREERLRAFSRACDSVITLQERERHGIGMQSEKTLHAVLKDMEEPDRTYHEVPISGCIADIWREGTGAIEIQTAHLSLLNRKLPRLLKAGPVRVVHPIPHEKQIILVDPETGHPVRRTRSPKKGTFYEAFRELFGIRPFLTAPGFTLDLLLIDVDEYRVPTGKTHRGRPSVERFDRIPTRLFDEMVLREKEDYLQFVPEGLPEEFTSADFAAAAGYRRKGFSDVLLLLTRLGVLERIGKRGRYYLYRVADLSIPYSEKGESDPCS